MFTIQNFINNVTEVIKEFNSDIMNDEIPKDRIVEVKDGMLDKNLYQVFLDTKVYEQIGVSQ